MFKYDGTGVKMDGNYTPAPEGIYTLMIVEATDMKDGQARRTQKGDPYVNVECEINDKGEWLGNKVYHNVTFLPPDRKGAGMALNFLKAIGEPYEGEVDVEPADWRGKLFRAKLVVSKDQKGRPRNEVAYLIQEEKESEVPF